MKTDREVKIIEIKAYFKEQYSHLIDDMKDEQVQLLWDLLNGRSLHDKQVQAEKDDLAEILIHS